MTNLPLIICNTLARTEDRTAALLEHLKEVGVEHVYVLNGIDGEAFGLSTDCWAGRSANGKPQYLSSSRIGNLLSHRQMWTLAIALGAERAIFLEDDALLPNQFPIELQGALKQVPTDWQFIYLGGDILPTDITEVADGVVLAKSVTRSHAYMAKRGAIKKLLECVNSAKYPIDWAISRVTPFLKTYCLRPQLIRQRTAEGHWESIIK